MQSDGEKCLAENAKLVKGGGRGVFAKEPVDGEKWSEMFLKKRSLEEWVSQPLVRVSSFTNCDI